MSAFERTLITNNSPYLQYLDGDVDTLTAQQKEGLLLFFGKANCSSCHDGPMLSDFNYHALGIPENVKHPNGVDRGKDGLFRFRTPTLHNVAITGPNMHNGKLETLIEVVDYMIISVSDNPLVTQCMLDPEFKHLHLDQDERYQLVAFLESLTDEDFDKTVPESVPSGLPVGGNIN